MIVFLFLAAEIFTFQVDVIRIDRIETLDCEIFPVEDYLVKYNIAGRKLNTVIDCSKNIFKDSFETHPLYLPQGSS